MTSFILVSVVSSFQGNLSPPLTNDYGCTSQVCQGFFVRNHAASGTSPSLRLAGGSLNRPR